MTAPMPSRLSGLSPGDRQRMLADARRKRDNARDQNIIAGTRHSLNQRTIIALEQHIDRLRVESYTSELIPIRLPIIKGPEDQSKVVTSVVAAYNFALINRFNPTPAQTEVFGYWPKWTFEELLDKVVENFNDIDAQIALYRYEKYGDPVAPTRHDNRTVYP